MLQFKFKTKGGKNVQRFKYGQYVRVFCSIECGGLKDKIFTMTTKLASIELVSIIYTNMQSIVSLFPSLLTLVHSITSISYMMYAEFEPQKSWLLLSSINRLLSFSEINLRFLHH